MSVTKFWIIHVTILLFLTILCCVWAYTELLTEQAIPTSFRVVDSSVFGTIKITKLQANNRFYQTKSQTPMIGYTFTIKDYSINKFFTKEDYEFSKGILADISFNLTESRHCDWICTIFQARVSAIKSLESNWKESICTTTSTCDVNSLVFVNSLIIGTNSNFDQTTKKLFINNNIYHIIVVSGFQLGILALVADKILKLISAPVTHKFIILVTVLALYACISGFDPPVVRSLTSICLTSATLLLLGRKLSVFHSMIYSMCILLLLFPYYLISLSFWLSILATCGVYITDYLLKLFSQKPAWWVTILSSSGVIYLLTLPLTSVFSNSVSIFSFITNLIILPSIPIVSLFAVLAAIPWVGLGFGWLVSKIYDFLIWLLTLFNGWTNTTGLSIKVEPFNITEWILYYLIIIFVFGSIIWLKKKTLTKR
jgi:ComEC/Rec2-related protein